MPDDLPALVELFKKTITATFVREGIADSHASELPKQIQYQVEAVNRDISSDGKLERFLVAEFDGVIIGCIAFGCPGELIRKNTDAILTDTVEIKSAYILPSFQQKGIGTLLFDSILMELKEKKITKYVLDSGYRTAQKVWTKKLGVPTVILTDFWGKDAHHMIWLRYV